MAAVGRRVSAYTHRSTGSEFGALGGGRSKDEPKDGIWSSMLNNVSSGKRLPEKSLLVLGGTSETQKEFLESLSTDSNNRRPPERGRKPPIANQFALGYTYQDVLDTDHEDTLARLSLYLLTDPSPSFTPLLKPLLTPRTLKDMSIVILLDWNKPWLWIRQLREWIRVLRSLILSLDDDCKDVMEETMNSWRLRKRHGGDEAPGASIDAEAKVPDGPGEGDEHLGIPLTVICQNADKIETLERERAWGEPEFDFILQYLRTILLKHGSSLIYTMPSAPGSLQTLVHGSLGIQSMLKSKELQTLRHNVVDRDRVLVPPYWDSWGKIRVLREGFDVEGLSQAWSVEIQAPVPSQLQTTADGADANGDVANDAPPEMEEEQGTAVAIYEDTIRDPERDAASHNLQHNANKLEVESIENQEFLAKQLHDLEAFRAQDEAERAKVTKENRKANSTLSAYGASIADVKVEDRIGPVQFNMGGIQVDADDMLKKLKDREANRSTDADTEGDTGPISPAIASSEDKEGENEYYKNFFSNLLKKTGGEGSATNSPKSKP